MVYQTNYKGFRLETHIYKYMGKVERLYIIRKNGEFITSYDKLHQIEDYIQRNSWLIDQADL